MEDLSTILFFSAAFFSLLTVAAAADTIGATQAIKDGETIVSAGETFELGFFSPGTSKYRYLGIWYKKISTGTVVWVANGEAPLNDTSGVFKVTTEGTLLLINGGDTVMWASTTSPYVRNMKPVAQLLDTGNLVVRDERSIHQANFVWQSFDYPGDTLLPGMKSGKDLVTGIDRHVTSWKSADDPSAGQFVIWMDTNGFPQVFERQGSTLHSRLGPWNGLRFSGMPNLKPNPIYTYEFVFNQKEIYFKFELINGSVYSRMHLSPEGSMVHLSWIDRTQSWFIYLTATIDSCARYALCGPYGSCNINNSPACSCMKGFEPRRPEQWKIADWSSGCQRRIPLECGNGDGFWKVTGVKFPDTRQSRYNLSMTLQECEIACKKDCSCTAYANVDIREGGSGCLLWFGDLMDGREYDEVQDLYIRMAAPELTGLTISQSGFNKKVQGLSIFLSISSSGLLLLGLSAVVCVCSKKKKRSHMKRGARIQALAKQYNSVQKEDLDLHFFSFSKIAKATNNFSIDNKLGEGGFGPVYKGVLEEGQEIAVKRLSQTSEQGLDEFQNEVICIAKLQHRNLVKLLGYCIHRDEMILIYEFMANKSLDSFLFDKTKSFKLDWPRRFSIIHGIARGILYLHQDSRLRIIHRDLKAGNILLDHDMNPKISDFGLARMFGGNETTAKTKKVVGTYGYISPEYAVHGRFSVKSDVFSFGVLVLEIVSGRKNREFSHKDHSDNLLGHAWRLYKEERCDELVSAFILDSCIFSEVIRSIHVALLCVQHRAEDRPSMASVVLMLGSEGALPPPKQPAFFTQESKSRLGSIASSVDEVTITLLDAR